MDSLVAAAGLIAVGALTPGPNNLIVLRESAARGWKGALPAATGILVGGLSLLVAVVAGANVAFDREPRLAVAMGGGACLLLAGLGLVAIFQRFAPDGRTKDTGGGALVASFAGLFVFQFLNPKAWVLVVAAVASLDGSASELETERLILRQWQARDFEPFAEYYADPKTARFVGGAASPDQAWRRMASQIGHWALLGDG